MTTLRGIPSLDGLRAFAVLLVLVAHESQMGNFVPTDASNFLAGLGHLGVGIFFVLSGFLITLLLVGERHREGKIDLRMFYLRRALRILPASYLLIAVVAALEGLHLLQLRPGDVLHGLTYTTNYHPDRAWYLGHLWSLAVEEQFYLLWPLAACLLSTRAMLRLAVAVVLLVPIVRVTCWLTLPATHVGIDEQFQFVCDGLATGCLLALLCDRFGMGALAAKVHPTLFVAAPVVVLCCVPLGIWPSINLPLTITLTNLSIALIILWCVTRPETILGRVLNSRPAVLLGTLSYSVYLWQQLFTNSAYTSHWLEFPLNLLWVFAAATASYLLVERPLLGLRARFRP